MNRNEDRLAVNIRQARRINRTIIVVLLIMGALLVGFNWPRPAHSAARPVYKGTVTVCFSPTVKSDKFGQYLQTQWVDVLPAAAKAAGVGKVRVMKEREPGTTCPADVSLGSAPYAWAYGKTVPKTAASGVFKLIDCWKGHCEIWGSQVVMSDRWGKAHTAAERQAELAKALKAAVPR